MNLRNAYFLLKCVFRYSENESCANAAREMLILLARGQGGTEEFKLLLARQGSFMNACWAGDVMDAFMTADTANQKAIATGMGIFFDARLAQSGMSDIWCEGLDIEEFLPKKDD